MTEYKERIFTFTGVTFRFEETFIEAQWLFRKINFDTGNLRHFYLPGAYNQTLSIHYKDDKGKIKLCRINSTENNVQWIALNAEIGT